MLLHAGLAGAELTENWSGAGEVRLGWGWGGAGVGRRWGRVGMAVGEGRGGGSGKSADCVLWREINEVGGESRVGGEGVGWAQGGVGLELGRAVWGGGGQEPLGCYTPWLSSATNALLGWPARAEQVGTGRWSGCECPQQWGPAMAREGNNRAAVGVCPDLAACWLCMCADRVCRWLGRLPQGAAK